MSKPKLSARMKSLSVDEKIRILEKLRDRSLAIAASGLRGKAERSSTKKAGKQEQLPRVFVDFNNADRQGRVRLNCVGTVNDLNRLGIVLREGTEMLLACVELEVEGIATYSAEEGLWVAKVDRERIRSLPGNE